MTRIGDALQNSKSASSRSIMGTKVRLDAIDPMYRVFAESANVSWYMNMFKSLKAANKRGIKFKMPFDIDLIMENQNLRRKLSKSTESPKPVKRVRFATVVNDVTRQMQDMHV